MAIDFLKATEQKIINETIDVMRKWSRAHKILLNPKSHRKTRVKARRGREQLTNELIKLGDRLEYVQDYMIKQSNIN